MELTKAERIWLKETPGLDEKWVQARIAEDPSILGLGELVLRDKERPQPRAGRLDLLLQDVDSERRYEVELQLGSTDESHIIRTVEYWDIERRRYPQYDHCAVIVAEDVTSRFLNVLSLFNGAIPIIAIQMAAYRVEGKVALIFNKVLNELERGLVDEDEEEAEVTDRGYWERLGSRETLAMVDKLLVIVKQLDPDLEPKYNKFYIGLQKNGRPNNFVLFKAKKTHVIIELKLPQTDEVTNILEGAGLELLSYSTRWGQYRFRVSPKELQDKSKEIAEVIRRARGRREGQ